MHPWVQSLVKELRTCKLHSEAKKRVKMVGSLKKDFYPFKKGQKKEFTISHFLKTKA